MYDITPINDRTIGDVRIITIATCNAVCCASIGIAVEGDTIRQVEFNGGCHGNTQGIGALLPGMKVADAIERLEGIDCHGKGTSCPDQLAKALKLFLK